MGEIVFSYMAKKITITETQFNQLCKCLTEARSSVGGMRNNSVDRFLPITKERSILSEGIDWEVDEDMRGGTIVFSTDVNAVQLSDNQFINWLKQKVATINNRIGAVKKIDAVANAHNLVAWTIGHNYNGRYKAKNGKTFGENSLTLDIVNAEDKELVSIATDICEAFSQECVLLKLNNGKVYFVDPS